MLKKNQRNRVVYLGGKRQKKGVSVKKEKAVDAVVDDITTSTRDEESATPTQKKTVKTKERTDILEQCVSYIESEGEELYNFVPGNESLQEEVESLKCASLDNAEYLGHEVKPKQKFLRRLFTSSRDES